MYPWIEQEALSLINRMHGQKRTVVFETGYGPSGPPHIGTVSEAIRTNAVRKTFEQKTGLKTKMICFSDDMDGLRKISKSCLIDKKYLGTPLSAIPDPSNKHSSYAEAMNYQLCKLLDEFNIQYEFVSATSCYTSGMFNKYYVWYYYTMIKSCLFCCLL